jgi:hypothetical protein
MIKELLLLLLLLASSTLHADSLPVFFLHHLEHVGAA